MNKDYCTGCQEYTHFTFDQEHYRWECNECGKGGLTYWS